LKNKIKVTPSIPLNPRGKGSLPFSRSLLKNIATLGPVGYLPLAPGTWGSACGLIFAELLPLSLQAYLLVIAAGLAVGIIAAGVAENMIGEKDSGHIIIDEFIGYLIAACAVPHTYIYLIAAFLLFRVFDILKPFPINRLEKRLSGGLGIMADDVLAGIIANILLQVLIWKRIF
jgi:phosphatidylglycerophosphatase A